MIAACLPTLGSLIAGGRAPESLVRSVRSIISLASRMGSPRSSKDRSGVRLPSNGNDSQHGINQLQEADAQWPPPHTTWVKIQSDSQIEHTAGGDAIELSELERGINVTKGVDVVRH